MQLQEDSHGNKATGMTFKEDNQSHMDKASGPWPRDMPPLLPRKRRLVVTTTVTEEEPMDASVQTDQHSTSGNISSEDLLMRPSSKRNGGTLYSII